MLSVPNVFFTLRRRFLAAALAAAAVTALLGYTGLGRGARRLAEAQAGERLYSGLTSAAAALDADILPAVRAAGEAGKYAAELLRSQPDPGKARLEQALAQVMNRAGSPACAALLRPDAREGALQGDCRALSGWAGEEQVPAAGETIVSPPLFSGKDIYYSLATGLERPAGGRLTLHLMHRVQAHFGAPALRLAAAQRRGDSVYISSPGRLPVRAALGSAAAAPFSAGLQGRSGHNGSGGRGRQPLLAVAKASAADWILLAEAEGPQTESIFAERLLSAAGLVLGLAFLATAAGAAVLLKLLPCPMEEAARSARLLINALGAADACADGRNCRELALVTLALEKARQRLGRPAETGAGPGEEADLDAQRDELRKLNDFIEEKEARIAALNRELAELRAPPGGEKGK